MKKKIIIKCGGAILENPKLTLKFARSIVKLFKADYFPIIVHGGGKSISEWMDRVHITPQFINGLRYTDPLSMEITQMVLSGKINKLLVNSIIQSGGNAIGLSGIDSQLFTAKKIQNLGNVGKIIRINTHAVDMLYSHQYIPVISPVSCDSKGNILNVNADFAACALACEYKTEKLIFVSDIDGIMVNQRVQKELTLKQAISLLNHADIQGGMKPKLQMCISALKNNVKMVHIINGKAIQSLMNEKQKKGTIIKH